MLTLVTGVPGAGKTLYTLSLLKREHGDGSRPIYVDRIKDINHDYFGSQDMPDPDKRYELPHGSILVFDEAQYVFPQRGASQKKPEKVEQFSVHRHSGYDIYITTQDANNVDAFIRRMTGRHFHLTRILNRNAAKVIEFDHFESKPLGYHEQKAAISSGPWIYDKKLFEQYKSATLHTHKPKTPFKLYGILIMMLVTAGAAWMAFDRIKNKTSGETEETENTILQEAVQENGIEGRVVQKWDVPSTATYLRLYQPIIPGMLHTAPIYQDVFEAKTFPRPMCIMYQASKRSPGLDRCRCYTQQMTQYDTNQQLCRYWAKHGFFDPTKEEDKAERGAGWKAHAPAAPAYSENQKDS